MWNVSQFYVQSLGTYSLMTDFQISSLSYADQQTNESIKSRVLYTPVHIIDERLCCMSTELCLPRSSSAYCQSLRTVNTSCCYTVTIITVPANKYPFVSCCLLHNAISVWHCTASNMMPGRQCGHDLSDTWFSQQLSEDSVFLFCYTASSVW